MNPLPNPTLCLVAGFVLSLAIATGCSDSAEPKAFAIDPQEVTAISASISNHPDQLSSLVSNGKDPSIEEFKVPTASHDEILSLLQGAEPERSQNDWPILGQLKLTTPKANSW